jgi:hypothetical protein
MLFPLNFDDYRHALDSDQHEAFYFIFTSADGQDFGFLRTLFGRSFILEIVALYFQGHTWVYQRGSPITGAPAPAYEASGHKLTMQCLLPWTEWWCRFDDQVSEPSSGQSVPLKFNWQFRAEGPATRYRFGPYQQVQQDGVISGSLTVSGKEYLCNFVCSRDHSWGKRQMNIAQSWVLASLPAHLYLAVLNLDAESQPSHFGHFVSSSGERQDFQSPNILSNGQSWSIEDAEITGGVWQVRRAAPPLVAYLGVAGREAVRPEPRPGDLYRDELGPAMYVSPQGHQILGFVEHARRIT